MTNLNTTLRHASLVPHRKEGDKATYVAKRKQFIQNALGELSEVEVEIEIPRTSIFKPAAPPPSATSPEETNANFQLQFQQSPFGGGSFDQNDFRSYLHLRFRPGSPEYRAEQARYKAYAQLGGELAAGGEAPPAPGPGPSASEALEGAVRLGGNPLEGTGTQPASSAAPI